MALNNNERGRLLLALLAEMAIGIAVNFVFGPVCSATAPTAVARKLAVTTFGYVLGADHTFASLAHIALFAMLGPIGALTLLVTIGGTHAACANGHILVNRVAGIANAPGFCILRVMPPTCFAECTKLRIFGYEPRALLVWSDIASALCISVPLVQ